MLAGLVTTICYAYDSLPSSDPIPKILAQYASWKLEFLRTSKRFNKSILGQPDFLKELLMNLRRPKTKPAAPQKHLRYGYDEDRPYRTASVLLSFRV